RLAFGELDERTPTGPRAYDPDQLLSSSWVHVAGVVEYDGEDSQIILYVDGQEVHRNVARDTFYENPGGCLFYVGNMYAALREEPLALNISNGDYSYIDPGSECEATLSLKSFPGYEDDVVVYDRALSADEIQALANE
ncbi:MAG: LamG domain-containing protein, partial [Myxococcales bacterium]|nr:LamG domain-containing protein [Myxococcales bacterium]